MERDEDQDEQKVFSPEDYLTWSEGLYIEYGWKQTKKILKKPETSVSVEEFISGILYRGT